LKIYTSPKTNFWLRPWKGRGKEREKGGIEFRGRGVCVISFREIEA